MAHVVLRQCSKLILQESQLTADSVTQRVLLAFLALACILTGKYLMTGNLILHFQQGRFLTSVLLL